MANEPHRLPRGPAMGVILAMLACGCFGDWVSARTAPRRETVPEPAKVPEPKRPPAEPCAAYRTEVALRCDAVLDGRPGEGHCHSQIVRVMSVYQPDGKALDHHPRPPERSDACIQYLAALPPMHTNAREPAALGPACREWAELLRRHCVAPLSTVPPRLERCGANLLAFESILGAITFGRPDDYEPQCRNEVDRLGQSPSTATGGSTG